MNRRPLVLGMGAAALAAALPALGQGRATRRIGWVSIDAERGNTGYTEVLDGLREAGYRIGSDLVVDARWGNGSADATQAMATDLVRSAPHIIVTQGPATRMVQRTGTSIPIVFGFSGDPVAAGLVDSFARPGRNCTGLSFLALDLVGKRIELLKEALPRLRRVALLANPDHPGEPAELRVSRTAAERLDIGVEYFRVSTAPDVESALAGVVKARCDALVLFPDAGMMRHAEPIAAFSARERVPAISGWAIFARRGNVFSYGPNLEQGYRRLAYYVDRILRGARPAELPVELPSRVELAVNLKAAKAIGLAIPASILQRADVLIET